MSKRQPQQPPPRQHEHQHHIQWQQHQQAFSAHQLQQQQHWLQVERAAASVAQPEYTMRNPGVEDALLTTHALDDVEMKFVYMLNDPADMDRQWQYDATISRSQWCSSDRARDRIDIPDLIACILSIVSPIQ